jgi:hypothetical protein
MMNIGLMQSTSSKEETLSFSNSRHFIAPLSPFSSKKPLLHALLSCVRTTSVRLLPAIMELNGCVFIGAPKWRFQVK